MQHFESEHKKSDLPLKSLYQRISDFHELGQLMPEQVINWESDENTCSFTISGMANISMRYKEKVPMQYVRIESVKSPFPFELKISLVYQTGHPDLFCQTILTADMNAMLAMMASRPLKFLVDTITKKLASAD